MVRAALPEPGVKSKLYVAVFVAEAVLGVLVLTFALPLADALPLGNVQGKGSPTWFWLVHGSPMRAAIIAALALAGIVALEFLRRHLRRRWRAELDSWS